MRLICRHSGSKVFDIVVPIPLRQLFEPGVYGVVLLNACRVDKSVHVLVPRFQSLLSSLDGHIVAHLYGERLKCLVFRVFHAILCHSRHQILAHIVVRSKEYLRPHRLQCLLGHTLQRFDLVFLAIVFHKGHLVSGGEYALHQVWIVMKQRMLQSHSLSMRERDALLERLACYLL